MAEITDFLEQSSDKTPSRFEIGEMLEKPVQIGKFKRPVLYFEEINKFPKIGSRSSIQVLPITFKRKGFRSSDIAARKSPNFNRLQMFEKVKKGEKSSLNAKELKDFHKTFGETFRSVVPDILNRQEILKQMTSGTVPTGSAISGRFSMPVPVAPPPTLVSQTTHFFPPTP